MRPPVIVDERAALARQALELRAVNRELVAKNARLQALVDAEPREASVAMGRVEAELRETVERLRLAVEASHLALWDCDLTTRRVIYSHEWKNQLGYADDEIGDELSEWQSRVHPDDLARMTEQVRRHIQQPLGPYEVEFRIRHRDGSYRWRLTRGEVYRDATGTPLRMMGGDVDITSRKEAEAELQLREARFRALIEGASDLIGVLDATGAIVYTSPSCERVLGLRAEDFASLPATEFVHTEDAPLFAAAVQRAREAPHTSVLCLLRVRHADGSWRRVETAIRSIPEQSADGFIVVNARDVTERHALEQQLAQAQKLQALGTLAGGIAHDFNNILAVVLGNAELARRDLPSGHDAAESIDEILRATQRARELVQRILLFSRPHEHALLPVQLEPLIEEATKLLRSTLPAGVELLLRIDPRLPVVRADALQIDQILFNLATNAWHAMDRQVGHIDVHVAACRVDSSLLEAAPELAPGPYVRLSVRDDGKGMDTATMARIFEPFFTTKPPGEGTGLGLSVVHGIVRSHGGSILVESVPGRGTTFDVYLPARPEEAELPLEPAQVDEELRGHGEHILYIDDEESLVLLGVRFLTRLGYRVTGRTRPADAIDAFRADPFGIDVVITDLNMPGMSGLDVARQVMAMNHDARVVLASGFMTSADTERARALGIREVILKPNTVEALGPLVHRLLRTSRDAASSY